TTCPAIEAVTAFPFTGFVNVTVKEKVSFELPSAKRKKLSTLLNVASTGIPQTLAEKLPVEGLWNRVGAAGDPMARMGSVNNTAMRKRFLSNMFVSFS